MNNRTKMEIARATSSMAPGSFLGGGIGAGLGFLVGGPVGAALGGLVGGLLGGEADSTAGRPSLVTRPNRQLSSDRATPRAGVSSSPLRTRRF